MFDRCGRNASGRGAAPSWGDALAFCVGGRLRGTLTKRRVFAPTLGIMRGF